MRLFTHFIIFWLAVATSSAFADCSDDEGTTSSIVSKCLQPQLNKAERAMAAEYNALLRTLKRDFTAKDTDARYSLQSSQKAWLNYRNQFCSAKGMAIVGGITARAIPELECQLELTESRKNELLNLNTFLLNDRN